MYNSPALSLFFDTDISLIHNIESEESKFCIKLSDEGQIDLKIPLDFTGDSIREYTPEKYHINFFIKKHVKETDIIELRVKNDDRYSRAGYAIPIISLESIEHGRAEDSSFLRYAFIGLIELFKQYPFKKHLKNVSFDTVTALNVTDIFRDDLVIVIIYNDIANINNFPTISPLLFQHGLIKLTMRNPSDIIYFKQDDYTCPNRLSLIQVSDAITEYNLIEKILHDQFPYERNPAFKFFILYQIIELLIEKIYQHQQKKVISELVTHQDDVSKSKDIISSIQKFTSEKKRISLLFHYYSSNFENRENFISCCRITFSSLFEAPISETADIVDVFYPIRNYIVHNYRKFPDGDNENIQDLTNELIDILPSLLKNYKEDIQTDNNN
jgi:uncharacterized protein YsxB (DUF464 family)